MEDIIVDEPAPISVRSSKKKKISKDSPKRDLSVYLFDWLVKALIIGSLININFVLFASAGNFSIFSSGFTISSEVLLVVGAIFALALMLMFLISFSSFLQNVVTSAVVGFFVYVLLNQFALFDKTSFLSYWLMPYLGNEIALNFISNSDVVATVTAAVVTFIFLVMAEKKNIAYFMAALLVVFFGILADEYFNRNNHQEYKTVYDNAFTKAERGKKFVYIMLPNAASISYLEDMKESNSDVQKVDKVQNIMLGFFAKNGFMLYQNAFAASDEPFMNVVHNLNNLSSDAAENFVASSIPMDGSWSFKNINDEFIYLNDSQLYNVFRRAKYKVSAYKTRGVDLCGKNGVRNSDRCVEKINTPISFNNMKLPVVERTQMLLVQWLSSMGIFNNLESLYKMLRAFTRPDNLPMVGVKFDNLYVVDTPQMLEQLSRDIIKDKGNQAYFILLDLPSNMFIYNEYCKIKPISQWLHMESLPWVMNKNLFNKRSAYLEQTACLYGNLEQFIENLRKSGVLDDTVIVVQGLNGVDDLQNVKERQFVPDFKNKKMVTMAIRDPLKKKFLISKEVCEASDILNQYLFRRGKCVELNNQNIHSGAKKELKGMLARYQISQQMIQDALKSFEAWYKLWNAENKTSKEVISLPISKVVDNVSEKVENLEISTETEAEEISAENQQDEEVQPLKNEVAKQAKEFEKEVADAKTEPVVQEENENFSEVTDETENSQPENIQSEQTQSEKALDEAVEKNETTAEEEISSITQKTEERVVGKASVMTSEVTEQIEQKVESLKEKMKEDLAQTSETDEKKE